MPISGSTPEPVTRRVVLATVARAAGVSPAQASAALNGRGRVSAATVERVRAAAERLGYVGNPHARRLRARRAGVIGVHAAWPDYSPVPAEETMAVLFGIVRTAAMRGYDTVVTTTPDDPGRRLPDADGMIVLDPSPADAFGTRILASDMPTVTSEFTIDGAVPDGIVRAPHREAVTGLLDHLAAQGARAVGMFVPVVDNNWARSLGRAYRDWCIDRGVADRSVPLNTSWSAEEVARALAELQERWPDLDALVSGPLGAGMHAADLLAAQGVRIGRDVLVAECGDGPRLRLHEPPITALDNHPGAIGAACADLLVDLLETSSSPIETVRSTPIDLVVRASTTGRRQ